MSKEKALVRDILWDISEHYKIYHEPIALHCIQSKFVRRLLKTIGNEWTFSRFCQFLAGQKLLHIIKTRGAKQWLMLYDDWASLSTLEQENLGNLCDFLIDPKREYYELKKQGKLKSAHGRRRRA